MLIDHFSQTQYTVRRKVFKLFGNAFHIYDSAGNVVLYCKMKAFKLREDIRLFTGEDMQTELIAIRTQQLIDFGATYGVFDSPTGGKIGSLKRRGLKSMIRDEWAILDSADREVGKIVEDSTVLALVRRFIDAASLFLPQKYHVEINGAPVCTIRQNFNPFVFKATVDFSSDVSDVFDRRLGLAAATLLAAIEGKQG